jgi:serine phosphatase RsbU (regulator of sigma subunit)
MSVEERLRDLADLVVPTVADWCAVTLVHDDRIEQVAVAHENPDKVRFVRRLQERYPPDPDARGGSIDVARTGVPSYLREIPPALLEEAARDATHLELVTTIGMRSAMVLPLLVRGRSLGSLTLVQAESGRLFEADDLAFAEQLAGRAALALDNARLYERQRGIARTLQAALLPGVLPAVPGLDLAARYLAQSEDTDVGGDVYDVVVGGEPGRCSVMVADVCGKGPEAAALTALIRHTLRAEASHGLAPIDALLRLNAAILREAPGAARFATVVHAEVRTNGDGATLSLVSAGHLPALVLRGDTVEPVEAPGTLLGVFPDPELTEVALRIGPGDSVLLYTDGVTEARAAGGELYGPARLRATLARSAGGGAQGIADDIIADVLAFQDGRPRDDVAVLVLQASASCAVPP